MYMKFMLSLWIIKTGYGLTDEIKESDKSALLYFDEGKWNFERICPMRNIRITGNKSNGSRLHGQSVVRIRTIRLFWYIMEDHGTTTRFPPVHY